MVTPLNQRAARAQTDVRASGGERLAASAVWLLSVAGSIILLWVWLPAALAPGDHSTELSVVELMPVLAWLASLGWLLVRLRPGNRIGWLFLAAAPLGVGVFLGFGVVGLGADAMPAVAGAAGAMGAAMVVLFVVVMLAFVPLLFPDGRLPGPRWRVPTLALVGVLAASTLATIFGSDRIDPGTPPNPLAIPGVPEWVGALGVAGGFVAMLVGLSMGVASIAVRFRRGRGDERQQLKWMLAAIVLFAVTTLPTFVDISSDVLSLLGPVTLALVPAAVTLAILRYRLYDIDRLISRSIAYMLLSFLLVATFVLGNLALQWALANVTSSETLAVAGSTLVAAAAAQPLRRLLQRAVDRRFDRARVDASLIVAAFNARQRGAVDLEAVVRDIRATAGDSMRPAAIGIWLRDDVASAAVGPRRPRQPIRGPGWAWTRGMRDTSPHNSSRPSRTARIGGADHWPR